MKENESSRGLMLPLSGRTSSVLSHAFVPFLSGLHCIFCVLNLQSLRRLQKELKAGIRPHQ